MSAPAIKPVTEIKRRATEIIAGIKIGEQAFSEGRVVTHKEAKKRLRRWLTPKMARRQ